MTIVLIPTNKGVKEIMAENIIRIEASGNYCKVYMINNYPLTIAKVLQWFEGKLPDNSFFRIHRGHIVNCRYISAISSDSKIRLSTGETLQVSKRKKTAFRKMVA